MSQVPFARLRVLSSLAVLATFIAVAPTTASAQEAAASVPDSAKAPSGNAAAKFYSNYDTLIKAFPGVLPIEHAEEYVGTSLLPFGSRDKAIKEAKENALKSTYLVFILVYDREERTQGLVSGISRVIKLRGVELIDKTPENVLKQIERPTVPEVRGLLTAALKEPEFAPHVVKLKALVQQDHDSLPSRISMGSIVQAIVALEGKESLPNLKKWAKYHRGPSVRLASLISLIDLGELTFVEETIKDEQDRMTKYQIEEKLRKLRLGS
jgi:hypothetical protein